VTAQWYREFLAKWSEIEARIAAQRAERKEQPAAGTAGLEGAKQP
jgi:hypothetical protein